MKSANPKWSILICTVPNRRDRMQVLYEGLEDQIRRCSSAAGRVEILVLCDNKTRSVGFKRQALLDIARGEFISFIDDDDAVSVDYIEQILYALDYHQLPIVDLVTFAVKVTIDGKKEGIVRASKQYIPKDLWAPLQEYEPPVIFRPPHMLMVWRTSVARKGTFPDENFGEDFKWARQCWPHIGHEVLIGGEPLYWWKGRSNEEPTVGM